ncbi:MAG TPA: hypothetical protein PLL33_11015 [Paracoccus sp. (in: a-proteobacteria)]|nr:hypothetical protein [Paracoccus sp. (in: a-proteobacteria)]
MEYLPQVLATEDGDCDITNAFCFSKDAVFLLVSARSDDEGIEASALLRVDMTVDPIRYDVLHEFDSSSLDYHAETPHLHFVLASGGYIHLIRDGEMTFHHFASDSYLPNLAGYDRESVVVFGDKGEAFRFLNGTYRQLVTRTDQTLNAMSFPQPGTGFAAGDYGTFLSGNGESFTRIDLGSDESIRALAVKDDGTVLLACADGVGLIVMGDELQRAEGAQSDFYSVAEFRGVEYWGDDEFGIHIREGSGFRPRFETGYAFNMNLANDLLTINAGYAVYVFDGRDWIHLRLNNTLENLVERAPLDFDPL